MLRLDHIAITCRRLEDGADWVTAALGLPVVAGGKHPHVGTHNLLMGMGDLYLEVIAIDPAAPAPAWPRWFDLDHVSGPPRLTNWVAACDDLDAALAVAALGAGRAIDLQRGDLRWRMGVPDDGKLPFDGVFPGLIQWQGLHPAARLPDIGARLLRLDLHHPQAGSLQAALAPLQDPRVTVQPGDVGLRAVIETPAGIRVLE